MDLQYWDIYLYYKRCYSVFFGHALGGQYPKLCFHYVALIKYVVSVEPSHTTILTNVSKRVSGPAYQNWRYGHIYGGSGCNLYLLGFIIIKALLRNSSLSLLRRAVFPALMKSPRNDGKAYVISVPSEAVNRFDAVIH